MLHRELQQVALPKAKVMYSPRPGFSTGMYLKDKSLQVRGGTGLFTGRVPFCMDLKPVLQTVARLMVALAVVIHQAVQTPITSPANFKFNADPNSQPKAEDLGFVAGRGAINVVDENLEFPQVFRTNLAVDKKLPWDIFATVEGIFSKTYNNVNFVNLNRAFDNNFTFVWC